MMKRGAPQHPLLDREDTLLLLIDVQERLFPKIAGKEWVAENIVRLIRFSRLTGIPSLLTEQQNLGDTVPEIREALGAVPAIRKLDFDCFGSEAFRERVNAHEKKVLIIAGIEAHICVAQTALHALSRYTVHVVGDATSSRDPRNREIALQRMRQFGATITSTEMLIYELLKRAGTDTFRQVLKLVT